VSDVPDEQAATVAFLSTPEAYGLRHGPIARHATHGSIVFLAGERAYKLKQAVKFPYMDYSTAARRKAMCEAELAVNRRLAPEIYIGVEPVVRTGNGALHIGKTSVADSPQDWLVVMRRFDQGSLLESMRRRGALGPPLMRQLGERIAAFHAGAEPIAEFGGAQGIAAVIDENRDLLGKLAGRPFAPDKIARLDALARQALADLRELLEERREKRFVRRCHGDLHMNNICVFDGRPVPFDAIEFLDSFACIDVFFDLAFLLMDMDRHGLREDANIVLNRYLERTGDYGGLAVLPLFMSCRAALRAHVLVAMADARHGSLDSAQAGEAMHLLDCAVAYLEPHEARLVAIGGVSGTGKSTLAAALAPRLGRAPGAIVLRSDMLRKQLWGTGELTRLPPEAYDPGFTARVYDALLARVGMILKAGYDVIADAVFGEGHQRIKLESLAKREGVGFQGIWLTAPTDLLEQRIAARRGDASDATADVLHDQLARMSTPADWRRIDVSGTSDEALGEIRRLFDQGAPLAPTKPQGGG